MTDACFVSWPLRADTVADLREAVASELGGTEGTGRTDVLPVDGVSTVCVFVHCGDERPALVWYVEHAGDAWGDPAAVVCEQSPLFPEISASLAAEEPTVVADDSPRAISVVHEALPGRPTEYADRTGDVPTVLSANDPAADVPDVVPLRLAIRSGPRSLVARALAGLIARTPAWLEAKFQAASLDVMAEEGMYTESLLLERTDSGYDLWWYMESGGMDQVHEAYYDSSSRIARVSEHALGWVLERPERVLAHPVEASDFELLVHAVDTGRE